MTIEFEVSITRRIDHTRDLVMFVPSLPDLPFVELILFDTGAHPVSLDSLHSALTDLRDGESPALLTNEHTFVLSGNNFMITSNDHPDEFEVVDAEDMLDLVSRYKAYVESNPIPDRTIDTRTDDLGI